MRFLLAAAIVAGLSASRAEAATTFDVHVFDFGYSADPTIALGDTVHWIWDSGYHSTTSAAGQLESWDSGDHFPAFTFDHTFTNAGVFNYYCDIHGFHAGGGQVGGMAGSVTVRVPEPTGLASAAIAAAAIFLRLKRAG